MDFAKMGPVINPVIVVIAGIPFAVLADVDPATFPNGIEMAVSQPGALELVGQIVIGPDHILLCVPPEVAGHMRAQLKQAAARQPGTLAPGLNA